MFTPTIILVNPQMGENIGMCARAMLNCGVTDLRLVNPRDGWPNTAAVTTASGATDIIENVQVFDTTGEAVTDLHYVMATTARPRDMTKKVYDAANAGHDLYTRLEGGQKCGVLFGAERTGLENEDIAHASAVITFPMNPDYSSLNLAQAVLLVCYEWRMASLSDTAPTLSRGKAEPAKQEDLRFFNDRLENDLETLGFFTTPETKETIMRNIISIFTRTDLTDQELKTLHGILSAYQGKKKKAAK